MPQLNVRIKYVSEGKVEDKIKPVKDFAEATDYLERYAIESINKRIVVIEAHIFYGV